MRFKVEFCGIHQSIFSTVDKSDWDDVEAWASKELASLVKDGRLHKDHSYIGAIKRLDR